MHIGEETFHVIRMNQVEWEALNNDLASLLEDAEAAVERYPTLERFFNALGYAAGERDTEVAAETAITDGDPSPTTEGPQ